MNLIEVYIQEVTRRLPEKSRKDIALELRSTIEDMLPDDYKEEDIKEVLSKLGNPAALASGYRDRPMHLIGPRYFDVYVSLLKMILPIAAVVALISLIVESYIGPNENDLILSVVLSLLGEGIWRVLHVSLYVFFWVTIVFAIAERTDKGKDLQPLTVSLQKWTPDDLTSIPFIDEKKRITRFEIFGGLMWTALWASLYFYANQLIGVYEGDAGKLEFLGPVFEQDILLHYWPLVTLVIAMEIWLAVYKMIKRQWTKKMAIFHTALEGIATIGFIIIISNPDVMNLAFLEYMGRLFKTSPVQFHTWTAGVSITLFILSAAFNVFDGFRKARIH